LGSQQSRKKDSATNPKRLSSTIKSANARAATAGAYYGVLYQIMDKQTISFRLDLDKVEALDKVAKALERDRTFVLNEAVRSYLDIQRWQIAHINASIREAEAGDLADHTAVKRLPKNWRRR
jgi:RHH-type transcriptional regulator, rel operon repressor / antitoxin RelB